MTQPRIKKHPERKPSEGQWGRNHSEFDPSMNAPVEFRAFYESRAKARRGLKEDRVATGPVLEAGTRESYGKRPYRAAAPMRAVAGI